MGTKGSSLTARTSRLPIRDLGRDERHEYLLDRRYVVKPLPTHAAESAIENGIGSLPVPLGVATNFVVDDVECLVTMATEERVARGQAVSRQRRIPR